MYPSKKGIIHFKDPFAMNTLTGEEISVVEVDNIEVTDDVIAFVFGNVSLRVLPKDINFIEYIDTIDKNHLYPSNEDSNIQEPEYQS